MEGAHVFAQHIGRLGELVLDLGNLALVGIDAALFATVLILADGHRAARRLGLGRHDEDSATGDMRIWRRGARPAEQSKKNLFRAAAAIVGRPCPNALSFAQCIRVEGASDGAVLLQ